MRLAHLILAHRGPEQADRLIKKLWHEDTDFYIHVDLKSDIKDFLPLGQIQNVFFIKERVAVYWGSYSLVKATVNGIKQILHSLRKYSYINLMSAQDYPLQSPPNIHLFFKEHPGKAFMHCLSVNDEWQEAIPRLARYHLTNYRFIGRYTVEKILNKILPTRKIPLSLIPVGRSQWFTITPVHAEYIVNFLKEHKKVERFFKLTWAPDEIIFQTILCNSAYKKDIVNDNLVYTDWSEGRASPKALTMNDAEALMNSGKLFARKFVMPDNGILAYIDKIT